MKNDYVFFGEEGITQTSANFIANQAKEYIQSLEQELDVNFIDSSISLLNNPESVQVVSTGTISIDNINKRLFIIGKCKSLIAWLREAIKAKEELITSNISFEDYCKTFNKDIPIEPSIPTKITKEDLISKWNIKERNEYYFLEAIVSVYGKYIHPEGKFSKARKELINRINNPTSYREDGINTIIKNYSPSIPLEKVDKKFFELQKEWREYQARFNSIKNKLDLEIQEITAKQNKQYSEDLKLYHTIYKQITSEYNSFVYDEKVKRSKLKIIIPNDLKQIYEVINNLGKD